jgi:hypothetical protein
VKNIRRGFVLSSKSRLKNGDGVFLTTDTALNTRLLSASKKKKLSISQKEDKYKRLKGMSAEYESSWSQVETDWALAKNLRGDTGIGLQRYVLGVMFSSVIAAANQMLEKVHGGRYRLFRSDEKSQGSNKKGLELKVFDRFSKAGDTKTKPVTKILSVRLTLKPADTQTQKVTIMVSCIIGSFSLAKC